MPFPQLPIAPPALRGLQNQPFLQGGADSMSANDPLKLAKIRSTIAGGDDLSTRSPLSDPGTNISGLAGNTAGAGAEAAADPFTGNEAQAQALKGLQQYQGAVGQGFRGTDPVAEQARYGQGLEHQKLNMPLQVQQAQSAGDLARQQEASRGALDVAKQQSEGSTNFLSTMRDIQAAGGDIRGITAPKGGGSISFGAPTNVPAGISQDVTTARQNLEKVKGANSGFMHPFGGDAQAIGQADAQLKAAIATELARNPADATFKAFAQAVGNDPQYDKMSLPEILHAAGEDQVTPQEMNQLQNLLYIIRGH